MIGTTSGPALILRQCRKALESTGRILIIEDTLSGKVDGDMGLIEIDLTMLVCHNGQERTLAEYRAREITPERR